MISYLALISDGDLRRAEVDTAVIRAAETALGWVKGLRAREWESPTGRSRLWVWTNEVEYRTGEVLLGDSGALVQIGTLDADLAWLLARPDMPGGLRGRAGDYSVLRVADDEAQAISTFARQIPVYHAHRAGMVCVGNRALLTHLVAQDGRPLEYDVSALAACVATGYGNAGFWTERTPFKGVSLAGPNSMLTASASGILLRDIGGAHARFGHGSDVPDAGFYDDLAEVFLAGLRRLKLPDGIDIALTGGKDSRVLVSALTNLDLDFATGTAGFDTDPDVVIAKRIAEFLGLPHTQRVPPSSAVGEQPVVSWDARGNAARELLVYDAMMFTVERLPRAISNAYLLEASFAPSRPVLTTKGSEVWRGGYASRDFSWVPADLRADEVTAERMQRAVRDLWVRNADLLLPHVGERHRAYVAQWLEAAGLQERPLAAAERFYLDFEIGRRDPPYLFGYELRFPTYQPFLQHEILRSVSELDVRFRRDDHIHYELISRFAPGLQDFALERKRWGFEWSAPQSEQERIQWEARAPLPVTPRTYGAWPMFGSVGSDYWSVFGDQIFSFQDGSNVWSFLDRQALERLFASEEIFAPHVSALFWVIYGLTILMSGEWLVPAQPEVVITSRHLSPWPAIYKELVQSVRAAQADWQTQMSSSLARLLAAPDDGVERSDSVDDHTELMATTESLQTAITYPAPGHGVDVERPETVGDEAWQVVISAEPGSVPRNSYVALPLGRLREANRKTVSVRFRHRSTWRTSARAYLVRYEPEKIEVEGPAITYDPAWQSEDFTFANPPVSPRDRTKDAVELTLLIGLGYGVGQITIADLEVMSRPKAEPADAVRSAVMDGPGKIATIVERTIRRMRAEHDLSDYEVETLLARADLAVPPPTPDAATAESFLAWARAQADAGADARQLVLLAPKRWPFYEAMGTLGDRVLDSLLRG